MNSLTNSVGLSLLDTKENSKNHHSSITSYSLLNSPHQPRNSISNMIIKYGLTQNDKRRKQSSFYIKSTYTNGDIRRDAYGTPIAKGNKGVRVSFIDTVSHEKLAELIEVPIQTENVSKVSINCNNTACSCIII